uniref:Putative rho GDP-dissociation inhibitor 1-like n=1 Tax=Davidia involucrata TaxID=16924 RepID=A0A5B7B1X1_DAVIN
MSALVGAISESKGIAFNSEIEKEEQKKKKNNNANDDEEVEKNDNDNDKDEQEEVDGAKLKSDKELDLGPLFSLKEQLEKDKDDESLRKWKEQLLGSVDFSAVGESKDPEVKILSLSILSPGRPDLVFPCPFASNSKASLFTLKEGSRYRLKFTFTVSNNIVSGLKYTNTVWKTGVRVDNSKVMLGTFSPQQELYTYELKEDTTPSGMFVRGLYSARTKVVDDDGKCYMDVNYCFEIQKKWPSHT